MSATWIYHAVTAAPRMWRAAAEGLRGSERIAALAAAGGALYGIWRSQIGMPRDELAVMTVWPDIGAAERGAPGFVAGADQVVSSTAATLVPTLRPADAAPPTRQGNYAFRWFETLPENWPEFLDLCAGAWPGFESAYDSQVIGLWRAPEGGAPRIRSLLLTRRPDLAMWERSKIPAGAAEIEVRRKLSRRYDLAEWTSVCTTTLLTASDAHDDVRWA